MVVSEREGVRHIYYTVKPLINYGSIVCKTAKTTALWSNVKVSQASAMSGIGDSTHELALQVLHDVPHTSFPFSNTPAILRQFGN